MRGGRFAAVMGMIGMLGAASAAAQDFKVGDAVLCDGGQIGTFERGRVLAIVPRPGWPDPFYEFQPDGGGSAYKCLPKFMKSATGAPPATPPGASAPRSTAAPPARPPSAPPQATAGRAPDGIYNCEYLASANVFIPIGTVTASRGQMTYRGHQPDSWKIEEVAYGGTTGPNGQPVVWVRYRSSTGISNNMRCLPKK